MRTAKNITIVKKLLSTAFVLALLLIFAPSMTYANTAHVTINGQPVNFADQEPVLVDGRTLVPVRGVFEALGFDVGWDPSGSGIVTLYRQGETVTIAIGLPLFWINDEIAGILDVPAQIINGRTMLPLRHLLESVGYHVGWDAVTRTVAIIPGVRQFETMSPEIVEAGERIREFVNDQFRQAGLNVRTVVHSVDADGLVTDAFAIMVDNSLWAFGENENGILGDGTTQHRNVPVKIMEAALSIRKDGWISPGDDTRRVTVLGTNGVLWSWGANYNGQLGDGTTTRRTSPVRILDNVVAYESIAAFNFALTADGNLWGWGANQLYQLGDGTTTNRPSPILVLDSVTTFSFGGVILAHRTDGSLWAWGTYTYFNRQTLETENTTISGTPIQIRESFLPIDRFITVEVMDGVTTTWMPSQRFEISAM